jgi:hypothetical protein
VARVWHFAGNGTRLRKSQKSVASGQWSVASVDLSEESAFLWGGADCRRLVTDHWPLITDDYFLLGWASRWPENTL